MDPKILACILVVYITFDLHNASATNPGITLTIKNRVSSSDEGGETKRSATCTLTSDDSSLDSTSECERGDPGYPGLIGIPGIKGDPGAPGLPGPKGYKGFQGRMSFGPIGPNGDIGMPGSEPGAKGSRGPPDQCPCKHTNISPFGTKTSPAQVTCKLAPSGTVSGNYYMGLPSNKMEVYCNMLTNETCVKTTDTSFVSKNLETADGGPLKMLDILNIYKISPDQIVWLQKRSATVRQTIKIEITDFNPSKQENFNISRYLRLMSWNDKVIGAHPTNESPIHYTVPAETDDCLNGVTDVALCSTIIKLHSFKPNRLPVSHIWIESPTQDYINHSFKISHVELCFG